MCNGKTIGFDVDGTLISFEDKPRYDIINLLLMFQKLGCKIIVASGGGGDYAEQWCNKLGLKDIDTFDKHEIYEKDKRDGSCSVDIWFDDEEVQLGNVNIKI